MTMATRRRGAEADLAFAKFDLGGEHVEDTGPWRHTTSDEWSMQVHLEGGGEVTFVVRFRPGGSEVLDAYVQEWRG
jgi:hypothetical protein